MKEEDSLLPTLPLQGYITVKKAAKVLGLAEKTVYGYIDDGKLPAVRVASSVVVEEKAVQNYKRQGVGRPRTRNPLWRIPGAANLQYFTQITVRLRLDRGDRLSQKLEEIRASGEHLLPGTVARYIVRSEEKPDVLWISLVWRTAVMPSANEREAALKALRAELAEVVDWKTARTENGQVLMHT